MVGVSIIARPIEETSLEEILAAMEMLAEYVEDVPSLFSPVHARGKSPFRLSVEPDEGPSEGARGRATVTEADYDLGDQRERGKVEEWEEVRAGE